MTMPCGSCGKPVLWFSKVLWARSVRPQHRQLPQGRDSRRMRGLRRCRCVPLFEADRRVIVEGGMPPTRVVPAFNKLKHAPARVAGRREADAIEQFALERGKETLAQGIVVAIADRPHRW